MSKKSRRSRADTKTMDVSRSALDRYRLALVAVVLAIVVGVIGYMLWSSATATAYTCESLLQGPPGQSTFTLDDFGDELPGFQTSDYGRDHD